MSFYEDIHRYYEDIFPAGQSQVAFLTGVLSRGGAAYVLDAACGTGAYARALARVGFMVTGLDFEEAMVREARRRAAESEYADRLHFERGDMRKLEGFSAAFDALICLGNSLPHLLTDEDIHAFFRGGREALRGGRSLLILQTVNFDRVLGKKDYRFPVITKEEKKLTFSRAYSPRQDGLLDFHTELSLEKGGETVNRNNTVPLRPLLKKELDMFLRQNGFFSPDYYGSFDFGPWNPDSAATILVASPAG